MKVYDANQERLFLVSKVSKMYQGIDLAKEKLSIMHKFILNSELGAAMASDDKTALEILKGVALRIRSFIASYAPCNLQELSKYLADFYFTNVDKNSPEFNLVMTMLEEGERQKDMQLIADAYFDTIHFFSEGKINLCGCNDIDEPCYNYGEEN